MPLLPESSKKPPVPPDKQDRTGNRPTLGPFRWWYFVLIASFILIWQGALQYPRSKAISYSHFKSYLARGQVTECQIADSEIMGHIDPTLDKAAAGPVQPAAQSASTGQTAPAAQSAAKPSDAKAPAQPVVGEKKSAESKPEEKPSTAKATENKPTENKPEEKAATSEKSAEAKKAAPSTWDRLLSGEPEAIDTTKPFEFQTDFGGTDADRDLIKELESHRVEYRFVHTSLLTQFLLAWLLPLGLIFLLWMFLSRGLRNAGQAVMGFGKTKARVSSDKSTGVTFDDVAGCDEAKYELQEVVDFLKNPDRYTALGAKIPKGVLLIGPPGTGKTLLSRAVAGEAGVPFFSISGSEFVEMFVGVGASRVRDLFDQAKAQAPCIIFIDELDAIGRERGVHLGPVNDEREQTLNQLLVEMDGFEANVGVILLAATNRPEVLDRALLRPGRFDRQVVVDAPDLDGRAAILKVHAMNKPLAEDVDLRKIAQGTPGFSGADLANALNEAALIAARKKAIAINQRDLEDAVEKVVAGPERKSRRLIEEERRRVAYHETGHALVATYTKHADQVHKISIVPRGRAALGYTLQLPEGEQFLMTRSDLVGRIQGLLGGRAAEELVFEEVSTGAENDLDRATNLARQMVAVYGMSEKVGLTHFGSRPSAMAPFGMNGDGRLDCSPEMADLIDREVKQLLESSYKTAKTILLEHRDQLEKVAISLMERETLDKRQFLDLLGLSPAEVDGKPDALAEVPPGPAPQ